MPLKRAWNIVTGVAIIAAAGTLAHLHVKAQTYFPVLRLSSPEGLSFTALQDETHDRRSCGEANHRFLAPLRERCTECKVLYARCERNLRGSLEQALLAGRPLHDQVVVSPGVRLAISGPMPLAKQTCDFLAADLAHRGFRSAVCIDPPRAGP